ncbi:polysaccharide lyase family 7 protein [Pseudomonas borbori]
MVDLDAWNLSIPVGTPSTTISTPSLKQGYKDNYFKAANGTVFFWAPVTGSRTPNAKYPRSELRETYPNGALRNWKYPAADNFLRAALSINQVPSSGRIVIGQIHISNSTKPLLKLEYHHSNNVGRIVAKIRNKPDDKLPFKVTLIEGVPMNQRFTYSIHLTPAGTLSINSYGGHWVGQLDSVWKSKPMYFKAGVYIQDNTGYASEGGRATFYRLEAAHLPLKSKPSPL